MNERDAERVPVLLFYLVESAELHPGAAYGFRAIESGGFVALDLAIQMEPQLVVHLAFDEAPSEERTQAMQEIDQHASYYPVSSTWLIAALSFRQASVSASSCSRPFRVSS